jgi:hypothetical protein
VLKEEAGKALPSVLQHARQLCTRSHDREVKGTGYSCILAPVVGSGAGATARNTGTARHDKARTGGRW